MDFGKMLEDIQTLRGQFQMASDRQKTTLDELQKALDGHYTELEQNNAALKNSLEQSLRQQAEDQRTAMETSRQAQVDFAKSHSEHLDSLEQAQGELRATVDATKQAAQTAASQAAEQGLAITALKKSAEEEARSLLQQIASNRDATAAKLVELRAAMEKMDASKPIGEMQKRLELMQTETARMLNSLGGQVESLKNQLEQAKEGQRAVNRIREDVERVAKRMDKLEQAMREQDQYLQDLANQRVVVGGGTVVPGSRRKEKKSPLPLIALGLSVLAILGMAIGGILLKQSQDARMSQLEEKLLAPQTTMASKLQDLSKQVGKLTDLAQATPAPTPTPSPSPTPTSAPAEPADTKAKPK